MATQHFSHEHPLSPLQLEGEKKHCKACERLIREPFHGCISCNYYLHDQCLNTPRWLKHESHSSHSLVLLPTPTYSHGSYTCNACGSASNAFGLSCAECEFDLHVHCANLPSTVHLDAHPHRLKLTFDSPYDDEYTTFICDVCDLPADRLHWVYYCARCDFGTHMGCAVSNQQQEFSAPIKQQNQSMNNQAPKQPAGTSQPSSSTITDAGIKDAVNDMVQAQIQMMNFQAEMETRRIRRSIIKNLI